MLLLLVVVVHGGPHQPALQHHRDAPEAREAALPGAHGLLLLLPGAVHAAAHQGDHPTAPPGPERRAGHLPQELRRLP